MRKLPSPTIGGALRNRLAIGPTLPASDPTDDVTPSKEPRTADVYFCGHTTFFPLNRALQVISKEKLTGLLRSFWEQEPIDLLARDGEIIFVTTRDPDLYCPETPAPLADLDVVGVARARDQQRETGTPFFLTLARQESIGREPALELMQQYGQKLFSQLWAAPRVWIMFEKNAELVGECCGCAWGAECPRLGVGNLAPC